MARKYGDSGEGQYGADLFSTHADLLDLATLDPVETETVPDHRVSALLTQLIDRATSIRDRINASGSDSLLAQAASVLDGLERLGSMTTALAADATGIITRHAHTQLIEPGAVPGKPRPHRDSADERGDTFLTRDQLANATLCATLSIHTSAAAKRLDTSRRLAVMPQLRQRLLDGDWTGYHLHLVIDALRYASESDCRALDTAVCGRAGRVSPNVLRHRVYRWLARHGVATTADDRRADGFSARHVGFSPVDLFEMRSLHGYLSAVDATAIENCLHDLASTAEPDDPRTKPQVIADAFVALFTGPAALSPLLAAQMAMQPYDPAGVCVTAPDSPNREGDPHTRGSDAAQRQMAMDTWQSIILLAATPA